MDLMGRATKLLADSLFGPAFPGRFDLTLTFEHAILSIMPACLVILATPIYLRPFFKKADRFSDHGPHLWLKIILSVLLLGIEAAHLLTCLTTPELYSRTSVAANILTVLGSVCIAVILYTEHLYSIRPSTFLSVYLSITTLFHLVKARSYFLRGDLATVGALSIVSAALTFILVVLDELPRRQIIPSERWRRLGTDSLRGFWNRALFLWLNSLLAIGFKNILTIDDLQGIGDDFSSRAAYEKFEPHWIAANKKHKHALCKASIQAWGWEYASAIIPRISYSALVLCQPLLLRRVMSYIDEQNQDYQGDYVAIIILLSMLLHLCLAVTRSYVQRLTSRVAISVRGALVTAISKKMFRLKATELQKSAVLTYFSSDVEQLKALIQGFHDSWASLIDVAGGLYILSTAIGTAAFLVMIPTSISVCVTVWVSKYAGPARAEWNEKAGERVSATANAISQLKNIKMSGLSGPIMQRIQTLRDEEIAISFKERFVHTVRMTNESFNNSTSPAFAIAGALFWTRRADGGLSITDIFVTLAITVIITFPLARKLVAVPSWYASYACLLRVQEFLTLDELPAAFQVSEEDQLASTRRCDEPNSVGTVLEKGDTPSSYAVELLEVSVNHVGRDVAILRNISMHFESGQVTMIIGPVGCGKSTLIQVILSEAQCSQGSVILNETLDNIAYCGQTAWIQNKSIRQNIIGQSVFDGERYRDVVAACALKEDFEQMQNGDETMAGIDGCSLSGGQKHRIAIARAAYSQSAMVVLDDVFSALDSRTASFVLSQLFGENGFVRKSGATVILATSSIEHLSVADTVFAVNDQGEIQTVPKKTAMLGGGSSLLRSLPKQTEKDAENASGEEALTTTETPVRQPGTMDVNVERQKGDFSLYSYLIRESGWAVFLFWLFTGCILALADCMPHIFVRIWMTNAPQSKTYYIGYAILSIAAAALLATCFSLYYYKIAPRAQKRVHWNLLQTAMRATLQYIGEAESGSILTRFSQDMMNLTDQLPRSFKEVCLLVFIMTINLVVIAAGTRHGLVLVPIALFSVYFVQYYYLRTARQIRYLEVEAKMPLYTYFSEIATGMQHIRALKWEDAMHSQMADMLDASQKAYYYSICLYIWLGLVLDLCAMGYAGIMITLALCFPSTTSQAAIGLSLINLLYISDYFHAGISCWARLESSLGSLHRTREFITKTPLEPNSGRSYQPLPEAWPQYGLINFSSATARYSESATNPTLRDMSFTVRAGQKVGIVGRTGSGKTSTLLTILNMLNISGAVSIDGILVTDVDPEILRSRIITIPQDGVYLEGTIRENIDPYSEKPNLPSDETLMAVLQRVGLADFVKSHGGLDEDICAAGLSQGQKQLLCIARAILRKEATSAKVILLDEATANVDNETGERIHKVMSEAFADCTVISVAHRLQALDGTDLVFNLEDGKITKVLENDSDEWKTWEEYTSTQEAMHQDEEAN